jgi:hypothetical protein
LSTHVGVTPDREQVTTALLEDLASNSAGSSSIRSNATIFMRQVAQSAKTGTRSFTSKRRSALLLVARHFSAHRPKTSDWPGIQ